MVRFAQMLTDMDQGQPSRTLEQMRGKRYRYKLADLDRWRTEALELEHHDDRHSLFQAFTRIEIDMEGCYEAIREMSLQCDRMVQDEIDEMRLK